MKTTPEILILGSRTCLLSGLLLRKLRQRGASVGSIDFQDFDRYGTRVHCFADDTHDFSVIAQIFEELEISTENLRSAFFRETAVPSRGWDDNPYRFERLYAPYTQEHYWQQTVCFASAFLSALERRVFCLFPRAESAQGNQKLLQLSLARQLGFRVPDTYIGSDLDEMRAFAASHPSVISKPFMPRHLFYEGDFFATHTSLFTLEDLAAIPSTRYPLILQEAIVDRTDIRVGLVGNKLFATEILLRGRQSEVDILDFRHFEIMQPYGGEVGAKFQKHTLPLAIQERCFAFMRAMDLQYSMMDLLLTPDGEYVFLENNPKGMHGEVDSGGHDVIGAVADLLMEPDAHRLR